LIQANFATSFDPSGGYVMMNIFDTPEHNQVFAQHAVTIPPGKMSTYSELMPHAMAHK
jgi:hypothetical protein